MHGADNGTINLNVSIGYAGDWYSLGGFTADAEPALNWTGTYANGNNQTTPDQFDRRHQLRKQLLLL